MRVLMENVKLKPTPNMLTVFKLTLKTLKKSVLVTTSSFYLAHIMTALLEKYAAT